MIGSLGPQPSMGRWRIALGDEIQGHVIPFTGQMERSKADAAMVVGLGWNAPLGNSRFFTDDTCKVLHAGSVLMPEMLAAFRSCHFLAAGFRHSLLFRLWQHHGAVFLYQPLAQPVARPARPIGDRATIHWFSHLPASKTLFGGEANPLAEVARHINSNLAQPFYYAVNNDPKGKPAKFGQLITAPHGKSISPMCQGSNDERHLTAAVWLTALKPNPHEISLLQLAFGIGAEEVNRAREQEALYQFVLRSNLRESTSTMPVDIYVFDQAQALAIQQMLGGGAVHHIGIGLPTTSTKRRERVNKGGRPRKHATPEAARTAKEASDKARYQRKRAEREAAKMPMAKAA